MHGRLGCESDRRAQWAGMPAFRGRALATSTRAARRGLDLGPPWVVNVQLYMSPDLVRLLVDFVHVCFIRPVVATRHALDKVLNAVGGRYV